MFDFLYGLSTRDSQPFTPWGTFVVTLFHGVLRTVFSPRTPKLPGTESGSDGGGGSGVYLLVSSVVTPSPSCPLVTTSASRVSIRLFRPYPSVPVPQVPDVWTRSPVLLCKPYVSRPWVLGPTFHGP